VPAVQKLYGVALTEKNCYSFGEKRFRGNSTAGASMPRITINDEAVDAEAGDNLLALARRNASHVWFVCDGRGLCRTCECQVLSGAENLSSPSKIERDSMSDSHRGRGYRLACQAQVTGTGPVSVISVAEELRRQVVALIRGSEQTSWFGSAARLSNSLTRFALDFTLSFPSVALHAFPQILSRPPDLQEIGQYFRDTSRIVERSIREVRGLRGNASK
jgi:ferredoxin